MGDGERRVRAAELVRQRREKREQKKRWRADGVDHFFLGHYERVPITLLHLSLLGGLYEPYMYPSLPPLMILMTRMAHASQGVEAHARDAFNLTWAYSMLYATITAVCLITGESSDPYEVTLWHLPLMGVFAILTLRAARRIYKGKQHSYPLLFRLLRSNGERSFMGNG